MHLGPCTAPVKASYLGGFITPYWVLKMGNLKEGIEAIRPSLKTVSSVLTEDDLIPPATEPPVLGGNLEAPDSVLVDQLTTAERPLIVEAPPGVEPVSKSTYDPAQPVSEANHPNRRKGERKDYGERASKSDEPFTGPKKGHITVPAAEGLHIELTPAQQQIFAELLEKERRAEIAMKRMLLVKEGVNIGVSLVTIVGGVLAIVNGVKAATRE